MKGDEGAMMTKTTGVLLLTLVLAALVNPAVAQNASITGTVLDSSTNRALDEVRVVLARGPTVVLATTTDPSGKFTLSPVGAGRYTLSFARLDYTPHTISDFDVAAGSTVELTIRLEPRPIVINPVIVSASRSEQKALDAPASVSVVDTRAIEERTSLTAVDHVFAVPGMDIATTGITQHEMVARGFNNTASGALLVMTDSRFAHVPSLRINAYNFIPLTEEDASRVEVVRGPGAALYGPNAANGVFHLISRSPFESPGLTVGLAGGERTVIRGGLRYATPLGRRFAVKLSAQYLRGQDWQYTDPKERAERLIALAEGADPDTLLIGLRDSTVERASGELRLDWRPAERTSLVTTFGANDALRNVDLTPLGAVQVKGWQYYYAQSRLNHGRLFAQAYFNGSNAGDTYFLRTGSHIVDKSQMVVAQIQHGAFVANNVNLTYGVDLQRTIPRTDSTITGRNEQNDESNEAGGYLHSDIAVSPTVRLIAAARVDYHSALPNLVFSPRAALVYQPAANQTFRLTYDRAFSTPTTNNLFTDIVGDVMDTPVPTPVRLVGVPSTGYSFRRDCDGGLCMRSAYTPASIGDEWTWLPTDVTLLWPVIVDTLAGRGIDISGVPQPTANDVATVLGRLNAATEQFDPVTDVTDIPPLKPTITNTIELGFRTMVDNWLTLGLDVYRGWKNDFVGAERVETPSAFYDRASLEAYLSTYMPAEQASDVADVIAQLPAATVTPEEARDAYDVLITYRNFGDLSYWGADLEIGAALGRLFTVFGTYSWTSDNLFAVTSAAGEPDTIPLNASKDRGSITVRYGDDRLGVYAELRGRAVSGFPMQSGVYAGIVESYALLDASIGYRMRHWRGLVFTLSATNLTDNRHQEFIGAPWIGRLLLLRARAEF